jgi:hypothetical protein
MADRRFLLFILPPLLLLPALLPGQEPPEGGGSFYIERTGEEERFIQRLAWEAADYAYRYEITIEKEDGAGGYAEIRRESQTEHFIELSLAPGSYRYRIQVYNLLNRPAGISGWTYFRVFPAVQPELYSFSQEFLPAGEEVAIILDGRNLIEGAEVYLKPADTGGNPAAPLAYLPLGERARLVFNREALPPGRYRVYVKNPGGLESSLEITVNPPPVPADPSPPPPAAVPALSAGDSAPRPFDLYVQAEYAPLIPVSGYTFDPFNQTFYPGGASLRMGIIPIMQSWGDLGLELAPSWGMMESGSTTIQTGTFHLNGLYHRRFFEGSMVFIFRLGAGVSLVYGTAGGSNSIFTWIFSAGGGIFLRWFAPPPRRAFYLEAGAEYTHLFAKDSPAGYARPVLGAGWSF